ncbi:Uncharacterised protein [Serratia plymuthica]|nr:Uncharacterised protein [Serratia plymuthica]
MRPPAEEFQRDAKIPRQREVTQHSPPGLLTAIVPCSLYALPMQSETFPNSRLQRQDGIADTAWAYYYS